MMTDCKTDDPPAAQPTDSSLLGEVAGGVVGTADKITKGTKKAVHQVGSASKNTMDKISKGSKNAANQVASTADKITEDTKKAVHQIGSASKHTMDKIAKASKNTSNQVASTSKSIGTSAISPLASLMKRSNKKQRTADEEEGAEGDLPLVPPDETLKKMDIIISKRLKGITVQQFYDIAWKEEDPPLYKSWLEKSGKDDINVQDWQIGTFVGTWDGEEYAKERTVTFRFTRTTHLYTGPPIADVRHTQFCRLGENRCVLAMTIEMQGIPFADCFNVQIRWVATRMGTETDLKIQVGLYVNFVKQTILASKIRSGTREETTKAQMSLFQAINEACSKVSGLEGAAVDEYEEEEGLLPTVECFSVAHFFQQLFGRHKKDAIAQKAETATFRLQQITDVWNSIPSEAVDAAVIESELTDIHASLDKILKEMGKK